jgi:RHS repeat-associated protein
VDAVTGENVSYTYDALNRLTNASASGMWNEAYSYDGFGNLTQKSGTGGTPNVAPSMTASFDANNHQVGVTYDLNGNPTGDSTTNNTWDVENRLVAQTSKTAPYGGVWYAYDPSGKRIRKDANDNSNGLYSQTTELYFYGITGQKLATYRCSYPDGIDMVCAYYAGNVYFGSKLVVSDGVGVVTDRLGSVRWNQNGEQFSYYPYGEERTNNIDGRVKFGTYFRDSAGQDYADQRYYNSGTGRFLSVDPGGSNAGDPGSLNRYAYVQGDPVNFVDPRGLNRLLCDVYSDSGGCVGPAVAPGGAGFVWMYVPNSNGDGMTYEETPTFSAPVGSGITSGIGVSGGNPSWMQETLLGAAAIAENALAGRECSGLFGGSVDPASEMAALVAGTVAGSSITYGDLGAPSGGSVTAATTVGILGSQLISGVVTSVFAGATITINDNLSAPWLGGYPDTFDFGNASSTATQEIYRAITLIHELGHFYNIVAGMGGSSIVDDGSGTPKGTSQNNSDMVFQKCFSDAAYR